MINTLKPNSQEETFASLSASLREKGRHMSTSKSKQWKQIMDYKQRKKNSKQITSTQTNKGFVIREVQPNSINPKKTIRRSNKGGRKSVFKSKYTKSKKNRKSKKRL
jgi:hypothetical protein